jgi:molecular chaperone GrpE
MSPGNHNDALDEARPEELYDQQAPLQEADISIKALQESEEQFVQRCREYICPQCLELAREREEKLRILADTENLKKRLYREKEDFCKFATQSVLECLLPVLDNLDLALEHGRKLEGCAELTKGVEMTRKVFWDILRGHELEPLEGSPGDEFDPTKHEALGQRPHPDIEPGRICQLVQRGYRLKGRLLRPAKVWIVGSAHEEQRSS